MYSDPLKMRERERLVWRREKKEERERREQEFKKKKIYYSICDRTVPILEWNCSPMPNYLSFKTPHVRGSLVFGVPNAKHSKTPHVRGFLVFGIWYT